MATRQQEAKDFAHFENLDAIRKKPGMYVGSTEPQDAIWKLNEEILSNSVDELANRKPKSPLIFVRKDGGLWTICDSGAGIPVELHATKKIPILQMVTSLLHAGGKFGTTDANSKTIGTHGVGIKAVSALSTSALFETYRERKGHLIRYSSGKMQGKGVEPTDSWDSFRDLMVEHGAPTSIKSGTRVTFTPDRSILTGGDCEDVDGVLFDRLSKWAHISVGLFPGLKIVVDWDKKLHTFQSNTGIVGMVTERIETEEVESFGKMLHLETDSIDFALAFTDYDGFGIDAYTNSLHNPDGGVHVTAAMNALTAALRKLTTKDAEKESLVQANIREGLIGILNYKLDEPRFSSQTKEKLVDERVSKPCYEAVLEDLDRFFAENPGLAKKVITRCGKIATLKAQYAKTRVALKGLTDAAKRSRMLLPGKLYPAPNCKPQERELYVVEGDSAAGSGLKARDARFQEILPLRGKIMNAMRTKDYESRLLGDEEIMNVLMAMGYNPDHEHPLANLRISKFILLTDADDDGFHIQTLFYSFIWRFMPQAFNRGLIYASRTYEYLVKEGKHTYFGDSIEELATKVSNPSSMKNATHLKGWGEIDPVDFATMAFDPATRVLHQVKPPNEEEAVLFEKLMGPDASFRAQLLGLDVDTTV